MLRSKVIYHKNERLLANLSQGSVEACKRRYLGHGIRLIIKADNGYITKDLQALIANGMHGSNSTIIVACYQSGNLNVRIEDFPCGTRASLESMPALRDQPRIR